MMSSFRFRKFQTERGVMAEVLVVGLGPVGLKVAGELARHGTRCRIIDRLPSPSPYCRAIGVTPRTLEVWDDMGVAREMIEAGLWITGMRSIIQGRPPVDAQADYSFLPYAHLGLPQDETELVLTRHLGRAGLAVERGVALMGLRQEAGGVAVRLALADGTAEEATFRYVVGCDDAHSTVRHALGIGFEGEAMPMTFMLGDVRIAWDLPYGVTLRALRLNEAALPDLFVAVPLPEQGRYRVSMIAPAPLVPVGGTGVESRRRCQDRRLGISRPWPTTCCRTGRGFPGCAGPRSSGSVCVWPRGTGMAASSLRAMRPISTRQPAARE
jgi:2-polyprenyl-6-methoxyphenol hydroxylase-like FAD-dependent oxidoreductase